MLTKYNNTSIQFILQHVTILKYTCIRCIFLNYSRIAQGVAVIKTVLKLICNKKQF
jgi:hypothetical protein